MGDLVLRPLAESDDRHAFDCRRDSLNHWLRRHAWRNQIDGISRTTVVVDEADARVAAYVSVCMDGILRSAFPRSEQRNRPDSLPVLLLGQLAVDLRYQGRGLGTSLIIHTFRTAVHMSRHAGCYGLITDPLDEDVRAFYRHFDFRDLPFDQGRRMYVRVSELIANGFSPD